jgi:hypothetical protein
MGGVIPANNSPSDHDFEGRPIGRPFVDLPAAVGTPQTNSIVRKLKTEPRIRQPIWHV